MGFTLGDALLIAMPAAILVAMIWALTEAFKPRNPGLSDAERYQRELADRSAAHQAAQVQAATAARARIEASTRPSQNAQQHSQQDSQSRAAQAGAAPGIGQAGYNGPILPNGQLNPQFALQLQGMVRSGQKIQAIKLLRQSTHSDLLTAKNYIDRL
jgi:ribosomal protein L7/L12